MASRAGSHPVGAGELGRIDSAGETEPAFSLGLRAVLIAAVVLLALYAVIAAARLISHTAPDDAEPQAAANFLALRAQMDVAPLEIAAGGGADELARHPAEPLDVAEQVLHLTRPRALAAVVVKDDAVVAQSGSAPDAAWTQVVSAARRSGRATWIGGRGAAGARRLYVVAQAKGRAAGYAVAVLAGLGDLTIGRTDRVRLLASTDGEVLAAGGVRADASDAELLGPDPAGLARRESPRPVEGLHGPVKAFSAVSPDGGLVAVVGASATRAALAANIYALLAPVLIGCGLMLTLGLQTRRVEAAKTAQNESERKFRLAVEAARCGIWEWSLRDGRVVLSDVTGVMLGWGGGGVVSSEDVIARIAAEHRERVRQALQNASTFGAFDVSFRVPRAEGGQAWIDARGQAFGEADALGYAHLIGVALDVTDERTAEHRAQAAERRLHDAIDSVSEAFVLWDRRGRLLMCNHNFLAFFALEARLVKPGTLRDGVQKMADLAVRRNLPPSGRRGVHEMEMTDGRWLQISERRTADGGLVMTAADITAVKRQEEGRRLNEEALQRAVERLEDSRRELIELAEKYQAEKIRAESANTAKSEFLANMSHELRTPLNAINGFSEMMVGEMFGPLGDRHYHEYAQDILSSGQHLLTLINDILDMSKIEAGKFTLSLDWMDVGEVVEDAVRLMRNRAETAGLKLILDVSPDLPEIQGDHRAIKQVLLNLISNALKFTPAGGRVEVRAWALGGGAEGGWVRVSVSDTGIGIAKADIGKLGRPFAQIETQHSKTQQGTGLGLALTRSLVELHQGVFELESEVGLGATASFVLPVQPLSASAAKPDRPPYSSPDPWTGETGGARRAEAAPVPASPASEASKSA